MEIKLPKKLPELSTTTLKYADRPLKLSPNVEELTVQQFVDKFQQRFEYSDKVMLDEKAFLDQQTVTNTDVHNSLIRNFLQQGFTDPSAFVVCNMGVVGHGLFADRDFEPYKVFILYAGKFVKKSRAKGDYLLEIDERLDDCIDSSQSGNLARFVQHMPFNYERCLEDTEGSLKHKLDRSSHLFWEYRNLICKHDLHPSDIAWSNLETFPLVIDGKVYSILFNSRTIKRGDQLGLSYGIGYWIERAKCPALFNLRGEIIPRRNYEFREVMISLPPVPVFIRRMINKTLGYVGSYTKEFFYTDISNSKTTLSPVCFHHFCDPVSIFDLRDLLIQFNVIGEEFLPIESDFVSKLRHIMPVEYRIALYPRNPIDPSQSGILDLVIRTDDLMKWAQLTDLLKGPIGTQLNLVNKCWKATQEVLFLNVQENFKQEFILAFLTAAKDTNLFTTPLKPEQITQGPTRNDPDNLWFPSSQTYIAQIIRHNRGETEKSIKFEIDEVQRLLNANINIEDLKSLKLSELTIGFFNSPPSIEWKVYPRNQLKGRYIGHNVRFYNIPDSRNGQAETLKSKLSNAGFDTQLITSGNKKSLVVDLSSSNPKI